MILLNEEVLKNLQEIQFGAGKGGDEEPEDYSLPEDDATAAEEEAPAEDTGTETEETTEDTGTEEEDTPAEDEETTEEGGDEEETGANDYTMEEDPEATEEDGDDTGTEEETTEEEPPMEEEDPTGSATSMAKKSRLLNLYKKFYTDLSSVADNIGERIAPLSSTEEYLYKIIVENIEKNKKLMYEYIENQYNTKEYEENIYQFYYFSSQVEMIHILLRKIKTYRDNLKNNIIKK